MPDESEETGKWDGQWSFLGGALTSRQIARMLSSADPGRSFHNAEGALRMTTL